MLLILARAFRIIPMSEELVALVNEAMKNDFNQYAADAGLDAIKRSDC